MRDRHGRKIEYLRVSLTDRCNLACTYCNPDRNFPLLPHEELLTLEEVCLVVRGFSRLGLKKVRLTGGEPLLRKGIVELIETLYSIEGIEEVCLTTNGVLLGDHAEALLKAGVRHVNISLDTLDAKRFSEVTGRDEFHRVMAAIHRVIDLGFSPVKVNTVLLKGVNADELHSFVEMTISYPIEWRFIEYMPIGSRCCWSQGEVFTTDEARNKIEAHFGPLEEVYPRGKWHGPARLFRVRGAKGLIGFISPISHHFCHTCNRLRLTPEGRLRLCLFSDQEIDLKGLLRSGIDEKGLSSFLEKVVYDKPLGPMAEEREPGCNRAMRAIGG